VLGQLHDPHTVYLDSRRLGRLDESTSGHYAGVGIQMDVRDSGITVVATLPGTPAEQAGILPATASSRSTASRRAGSRRRKRSRRCAARRHARCASWWSGPA
jgi:hypothetical protein